MNSDTDRLNLALTDRYRIDRELGAGGMATVYLAHDLRHDRKVALKVLKPELGAVLGVERFLAEIRVTANLQHPNLLPLFDSGAADGLLFYVMPFVEGESLRARIDREKQLPVDEVVRISTAIASALAFAHERGIIHRDLKPENVLLQAGQPVIADFGIALAVSQAGGKRVTQSGISLGTPQYMSPEQATGDRTIDARSDIYSLGALTYEMLAGDPPHLGSTAQAIFARVLTERPPSVLAARPTAGNHVAYAVERALEKLPADRWSSASEFVDAMRGTGATGATTRASGVASGKTVSRQVKIALGALAVVAVAGVGSSAWLATRPVPTQLLGRFTIELPDSTVIDRAGGGRGNRLAISRDGSLLVFAARQEKGPSMLYLRRLEDPIAQPIRGTEGATQAALSPDGQSIVFSAGSGLNVVSVLGGTPSVIAKSGGTPHWGDTDLIAYAHALGIETVTPDGRRRHSVSPDSANGIVRVAFPNILPGGSHVLITWWKGQAIADSARLGVVSLTDSVFADLGVVGSQPRYVVPGYILFGRGGGELYAAPFSLRSRALTGPPALIAQGVWQNPGGQTAFVVSDNGTLVYEEGRPESARNVLCIVDQRGAESRLSAPPAAYGELRVSPDGRRIAARTSLNPFIVGDIVVHDINAGTTTFLASHVTAARLEWTRDGTQVVYTSREGDSLRVMSRRWDLSEPAHQIALGREDDFMQIGLGRAGEWAVIRRGGGPGPRMGAGSAFFLSPTDSLEKVRPFLADARGLLDPIVSPNGRLLAYTLTNSRGADVYVTTIPGPGPRVPVSANGGSEPVWSSDGATLFYRKGSRMMAARVVDRPAFAVTRSDMVFDVRDRYLTGSTTYDVLPDGRFVMLRQEAGSSDKSGISLSWVFNWPRLRERATPERQRP